MGYRVEKGKSNGVIGLGKLGRVMLLVEILEIVLKILVAELNVVGGSGVGETYLLAVAAPETLLFVFATVNRWSEVENDDMSDDLSRWEVDNAALCAFQFDRMDESDKEAHDLSGKHLLPPHHSSSLPQLRLFLFLKDAQVPWKESSRSLLVFPDSKP
ncbi:hypothetical protein QYF36_001437 [Acer negundo]|nr:hypothetical protein QYF36_001437 [Acer negundo]